MGVLGGGGHFTFHIFLLQWEIHLSFLMLVFHSVVMCWLKGFIWGLLFICVIFELIVLHSSVDAKAKSKKRAHFNFFGNFTSIFFSLPLFYSCHRPGLGPF